MCFSWRKGAFDSLTSLRLSEMQAKGAWMVGFHAWSGTELRSWCVSIVVQLPETSRHFFDTVAANVAICSTELRSVTPCLWRTHSENAILEDSTQLYKQLSTVAWFALGRELEGSRQARHTDQKLKRWIIVWEMTWTLCVLSTWLGIIIKTRCWWQQEIVAQVIQVVRKLWCTFW